MIGQSVLAEVVCAALFIYTIILFVRVIVSWAELFGFRRPYRSFIPPVRAGGVGLDLSIIIAFVILFVLRSVFC